MKKILIIIGSLDIGGTEKQLFNILQFIHKKFDIHICLIHKKGNLFNEYKKLNIKIHCAFGKSTNKIKRVVDLYINVHKIINEIKPYIVHFYLPHSYIVGGIVCFFKRNLKLIMSRRSLNDYQKKYFLVKFIEIILHKRMDYIISNSECIMNQLQDEEFVSKKKSILIYNNVTMKKFVKKRNKPTVKVLLLANIIDYKNHEMVINACKLIKSKKKWTVSFAGDYSDKQLFLRLKNLVKIYKLEKKIFFLGQVSNTTKILNNSDIGILASNEEGFSNSILEYYSHSLPVIATNVGGNPEIVRNGYNGFLIKKKDVNNFAKSLGILIENHSLRLDFARNGYNLISKKLSFKNTLNKYKDLYTSI